MFKVGQVLRTLTAIVDYRQTNQSNPQQDDNSQDSQVDNRRHPQLARRGGVVSPGTERALTNEFGHDLNFLEFIMYFHQFTELQ